MEVLLFFLTLSFLPLRAQVAQILSISNNIIASQGNQMSSLGGGTVFYLQGSGFDPILSNNQVFINSTIPVTLQSTTTAYLVIVTPAMPLEGNYNISLLISGSSVLCLCTCQISYLYSFTPQFIQLSPISASPGETLTLTGYPNTNLASNVAIWLGGLICVTTYTVINDMSLNTWSSYSFTCPVPQNLNPNYYPMIVSVNPQGLAVNYPVFTIYNTGNSPYNFQCVPTISSLNSNIGSPLGQKINIYGIGFSSLSSVSLANTPCEILAWNSSMINCLVPQLNISQLQMFIQGRGLQRSLYTNNNMALQKFEMAFWNNNLANEGFYLYSKSLQSPFERTSTETNLFEVYSGYFLALVTGNYTFFLYSDTYCEVYLSNVSNSSSYGNLVEILEWNQTITTIPSTYNVIQSQPISLNQSELYLFQTFKSLVSNPSYIRLAVETPLSINSFSESVQVLTLSYSPIREQLEIKIYNWKMGTFKILVQGNDPVTGALVYYKITQALDYNIVVNNLTNILSTQMGWGLTSMIRYNLSNIGAVLNSSSPSTSVAGFMFHINMTIYRDNYKGILYLPKVVLVTFDTLPRSLVTQVVAPTPCLTGTYGLLVNGILLANITSNTSSLSNYLALIPGYNRYVTCEMFGSTIENRSYVITFSGIPAPVPLIQVLTNNLVGGQPNYPPQISVTDVIDAGTQGFYRAIPDDLIVQGNDQNLQVNVWVNGILGKCPNGNCNYMINQTVTPILLAYNLTNQGLSILLSNYQNYIMTPVTISVEFALSTCSNLTIILPYINCSIPTNPDGTLILAAGSYMPLVHIYNIGYAVYGPTVLQTTIVFSISALNLLKGSIMGGQTLVISGNGFPPSIQGLNVSIGMSIATVINVTNIEITLKTQPQTQNNTIIIWFNGVSDTNEQYQYDLNITPVIVGVNPQQSSPVQKAILSIQGFGFGNDSSKVNVFLDKNDNVTSYQLSEISLDSINGVITAVLSGGSQGNYTVRVNIEDIGDSMPINVTANLFFYELIVLNVSPNIGSVLGGTLLSINGVNFSPILNQNQVFIGDEINAICDIIFSNESLIQCVTRPCDSYEYEQNLGVFVTQRVQENAQCGDYINGCFFNFTMAATPEIFLTDAIINVFQGDSITLIGSNLNPTNADDNAIIIFFDDEGVEISTVYSSYLNDTNLIFIMPGLADGLYELFIEIPNKGLVLFDNLTSLVLNNTLAIINITLLDNQNIEFPLFNSSLSKGGVYLAITANGLEESDTIYIQNSGYCMKINAYDPSFLICKTRNLTKINTNYIVFLYRGSNIKLTCPSCYFNISQLASPTINSQNLTTICQTSNFSISLIGSELNITNNLNMTLDSFDNSLMIRTASYQGIVEFNSTAIIANFLNIPPGQYLINGEFMNIGLIYFPNLTIQSISVNFEAFNINPIQTGFLAGPFLTITSQNVLFPANNQDFSITVCGINCPINITNINALTVNCEVPMFISDSVNSTLPIFFTHLRKNPMNPEDFIITSDNNNSLLMNYIIDGEVSTYYDSSNSICFLELDFGVNFTANLNTMSFTMNPRKSLPSFYGLLFQYSLDNIIFYDLFELGPLTLHSGNNIYKFQDNFTNIRAIRLQSPLANHPSRCDLAEISFTGIKQMNNTINNSSQSCDVIITSFNNIKYVMSNVVKYSMGFTPVINGISPNIGPSLGGTTVSINGQGFGNNMGGVNVLLNGIVCGVQMVNDSMIICLTGQRIALTPDSLDVLINGNRAAINSTSAVFIYVDNWSDSSTWGGELPPRDGDSVYIPSGQSILLDVSIENVNAIIIEGGRLIFSDQNLTFSANYLICLEGEVLIGSEDSPITSQISIIMLGNSSTKQLPIYGNKVWALENSRLEIHGLPRNFYRTLLNETAEIGDLTISVSDVIDWQPGEMIVIATNTIDNSENEVRTIVSINTTTISFDIPLNYRHFMENNNSYNIKKQCEILLLTRNIVFQGEIDNNSIDYGMHIYLSGNNSLIKISNAEFFNMGQANMLNRYPLNVINIEDGSECYIQGNSIHDSFARAISLENSHYLKITKNMVYNIRGSAFVLTSGIESNNVFIDNIVILVNSSKTLTNIDLSPSAFYISNPSNVFLRNIAISSDFAGFNFDFQATSKLDPYICPMGIPLMKFDSNIAHSNQFFGLFIYQYMPRTFPCNSIMNLMNDDPFINNPGLKATISNFSAYQNGDASILAEYMGNIDFIGIFILDIISIGIQISDTRYTYIDGIRLLNSMIIGGLNINGIYGLITPRTDNFFVSNITFLSFLTNYSAAIYTCSKCVSFLTNGGHTIKFQSIFFINVLQRILLGGYKKDIIWDLDGSLTGIIGEAMLTGYFNHLSGIPQCFLANSTIFDKTIICNSSVKIRPLIFSQLLGDGSFIGMDMKVIRIPNGDFNVSALNHSNDTNFTIDIMKYTWTDTTNSWVLPFVTGLFYNIHWNYGNLDFTHMSLYRGAYWNSTDFGIILKFNCSDYKDDYDIEVLASNNSQIANVSHDLSLSLTNSSSLFGDYSFNNATLDFLLLITPQCQISDFLDISTVIYPQITNDSNSSNTTEEEISIQIRYWSNDTLWPLGRMPIDSEDVYIPAYTTIYLDVDTANLGTLTIDGALIFQSITIIRLNAQRIWVRDGVLIAGNSTDPYKYPIEINLLGDMESADLIIDDFIDSGNKILAITGQLTLISDYPQSGVSRKLTSNANNGSLSVSLNGAVDWKIGDQIVIGPSEFSPDTSEIRMIISIENAGFELILDLPLNFFHYGCPDTDLYLNSEGLTLDMRATVGLLSRNIMIQGDQEDNWGCNILIYEYTDVLTNILRAGTAELVGVGVQYCGQADTDRAAFDVKFVRTRTVTLTASSIYQSYGWGINIESSLGVNIIQNVIYYSQNYLLRIYYGNFFDVSNNLLIGAQARNNLSGNSSYYDMVAGVYLEQAISSVSFSMKFNIIQGCQGNGFVLPGFLCYDSDNSFLFNQANSMQYAGFLITNNNSQCLELRNFTVFSCGIGVLTNFDAAGVLIRSGIFAENQNGIYSSFVRESLNNSIIYSTLSFFSLARIDCLECYNYLINNPQCSSQIAIIIPIITISRPQTLPLYGDSPYVLLDLYTDAAFDQEFYISNSQFFNYQLDYSEMLLDLPLFCSQNTIISMLPHAPDAISSIYLINTTTINSNIDSFFELSQPDPDYLGLLGGCGDFNCTGQTNWLLTDLTGDFLNLTSQIIPELLNLQAYQCFPGKSVYWNASFCLGTAFGILQFENPGLDQRLRPIAPVNISSLQMADNVLNQWKEWDYQGNLPMNRRLSRFHGVIELNVTTNISFVVAVPEILQFSLESIYDDDFLLVNIIYERSDIIEVYLAGSFVSSLNNTMDLLGKAKKCGSNYYNSSQNSISFIITGHIDCVLTVRTVNYVQVSLRLQTTIQSFYTNSNIASFIDQICSFLGIDFSRLRIAGIRTGSVIIDFNIIEDISIQIDNSIDLLNETAVQEAQNASFSNVWLDFAGIIEKLTSNINNSYGLQWNVMDIQAQPMISNPGNFTIPPNNYSFMSQNQSNQSNESNGSLIIVAENKSTQVMKNENNLELMLILGLVLPLIFIIVAITCCCYKTKEGVSLFRMLLNRILSKKSPSKIYPKNIAVDQVKNIAQIMPDIYAGKVFDIEEENQSYQRSERTLCPSSNVISPMKASKSKMPFIFHKDQVGTIDSMN